MINIFNISIKDYFSMKKEWTLNNLLEPKAGLNLNNNISDRSKFWSHRSNNAMNDKASLMSKIKKKDKIKSALSEKRSKRRENWSQQINQRAKEL